MSLLTQQSTGDTPIMMSLPVCRRERRCMRVRILIARGHATRHCAFCAVPSAGPICPRSPPRGCSKHLFSISGLHSSFMIFLACCVDVTMPNQKKRAAYIALRTASCAACARSVFRGPRDGVCSTVSGLVSRRVRSSYRVVTPGLLHQMDLIIKGPKPNC